MKTVVKYILLLLILVIGCCFASCNKKEEYQPNQPVHAYLPPYSEVQSSNNANCNHQTRTVFVKTTEFGDEESIDACIKCGYSVSGYKFYYTRADFDKDCMGEGKYFGKNDKIIINLDSNYNDLTLSFQSNVNEVVFVGKEGQTNKNLSIQVLNRTEDMVFDFFNAHILSENNVLMSQKSNAKIIVRTHGESNSLATQRGADGKDGSNGYTKYGQQTANPGSDGKSAADVFLVKGDIEFVLYAPVSIYGGNGGRGGNGASLNGTFPSPGGGGAGGDGGDGGDAINAEGVVFITGDADLMDVRGGTGGSGGTGGHGRKESDKAANGSKGKDGKTGLE